MVYDKQTEQQTTGGVGCGADHHLEPNPERGEIGEMGKVEGIRGDPNEEGPLPNGLVMGRNTAVRAVGRIISYEELRIKVQRLSPSRKAELMIWLMTNYIQTADEGRDKLIKATMKIGDLELMKRMGAEL